MTGHSHALKNGSFKSITHSSVTGKSIETGKVIRSEVVFRHNDSKIGDMDIMIRPTASLANL